MIFVMPLCAPPPYSATMGVQALPTVEPCELPPHCRHCGQPAEGPPHSEFCCTGCEVVYQLLQEWGLQRFYDLRPGSILPALQADGLVRELPWLDALAAIHPGHLVLDIDGLQCGACVWVIRTLALRTGHATASIDTVAGQLTLRYDPGHFLLREYLQRLAHLGYRTAPPRAGRATIEPGLLARLGICAAIAMNTMFLAVSVYLGLDVREPQLLRLFCQLNAALSVVSVAVGGSYFFRRAWQGLRAGVLHFDVPIALGILAAFAGSLYAQWTGRMEGAYFDTLNIFIALMLAGRVLQSGFMARNRRLDHLVPALGEMTVLRVAPHPEEICLTAVRAGDRLAVAPGGIVPTGARLLAPETIEVEVAWMTGEALPITVQRDRMIPAGAHLVSAQTATIVATTDFAHSQLSELTPIVREQDLLPNVGQWVIKWYVAFVVAAAFSGVVLWWPAGIPRALAVAVSILVITCPCSLGIAIPLARSYANRALVRRGVFARDGRLLDKLAAIRHIVFDKTGTLTFAVLQLCDPALVQRWSRTTQAAIFNIAARSHHPASQALFRALLTHRLPWRAEVTVDEMPGTGVEAIVDGTCWRIGRPERTAGDESYTIAIFRDGREYALCALTETPLDNLGSAMAWCRHSGRTPHLVSGDRAARVAAFARQIGIPDRHVRGEMSPIGKRDYLQRLAAPALMLGDGLNDAPACGAAAVCGAPLHDRAAMAGAADFYFIARSLRWLPDLFRIAAVQQQTIRVNFTFAIVYNIVGVTAGLFGLVHPLTCAIAMPLSSLAILLCTIRSMRRVA